MGRGVSRASSKAQSRDGSRPPSAIENNIDYFKEPVVKVSRARLLVIIVTKLVCSVAAGADPRAVSRAADDALPRPDQLDRAPRHRQDIPGHAVRAGVRSVARVTCHVLVSVDLMPPLQPLPVTAR